MALDNLTLLFSLALVSGLMGLSLWASADPGRRDGMRLWAFALALESAGWSLVAGREHLPPWLSILCANLALTSAQSLKLGALFQYRNLPWPRTAMLWPPIAMLVLLFWLDNADFRGRLIYGSLIYAAQAALLLQGLRAVRRCVTDGRGG